MFMDSEQLAELAADACDDRKAADIRLIRVDEVSSLADWMVIAGGQSDVQVRAIARSVQDRLETEAARLPLQSDSADFAIHKAKLHCRSTLVQCARLFTAFSKHIFIRSFPFERVFPL